MGATFDPLATKYRYLSFYDLVKPSLTLLCSCPLNEHVKLFVTFILWRGKVPMSSKPLGILVPCGHDTPRCRQDDHPGAWGYVYILIQSQSTERLGGNYVCTGIHHRYSSHSGSPGKVVRCTWLRGNSWLDAYAVN